MEMIVIDPSRSSQIAQIGHDGQALCLVLFRRSGLYEHGDVDADFFERFKKHPKPGEFYAANLLNRQPYRKLGDDLQSMPTAAIVEVPSPDPVPESPKPEAALPPEAQAVSRKSTELTVQASSILVSSPESQQQASDVLLTVAAMRKEIADTFKPMKDAAFKSHRTICDQEKTLDAPLLEAEKTLKTRIGDYVMEQQCIAREAEEALRKEELERAQRESREEGERLAIIDAIDLEAAGDIKAAEAVLNNPAPAPMRYVAPAPVAANVARTAGVSTRMEWDFRITNEALIPREYLLVNESAIKSLGKTTKGKAKITGVEFYEKPVVAASRTAKSA